MSRSSGDSSEARYFPGVATQEKLSRERQNTVAIIEDEKDIVEIYSRICALMGLTISFIAYDGAEGLEAFRHRGCPDVVLIDHRMPNMTGIEAMERMLDINPGASFIVLSADEEIRQEALDAGACEFIKKPASIAQINGAIRKVLERR